MLLNKILRTAQILSLDVAIGACTGALFIGKILNIILPASIIICLGLTVWLIYTIDHLLDAKQIKHEASTERHRFHQKFFKEIQFVSIFIMLLNCSIVLFLPFRTFFLGSGLILIIFIYFYFQNKILDNNIYKEPIAAILYVIGIFLGPLSIYHGTLSFEIYIIFFQYLILAFFNMILFSFIEIDSDRKDNQLSISIFLGEVQTVIFSRILIAIFLISNMISLIIFRNNQTLFISEIIIITMGATLFGIFRKRSYFAVNGRYRLGDLIFLYPLLILKLY